MYKTLFTLLTKLGIKSISKEELEFQIKSHPSYPSLHAMTGVLTHFNIDNIALNIPVDEDTLAEMPKQFIAQLRMETAEDFVVVVNDGLYYDIYYSDKPKLRYGIDEFIDRFTGIIVAVEVDSYEEVKVMGNSLFNKILLMSSFFMLVALIWISNPAIVVLTISVILSVGVYISLSILKQEQGEKTLLGEAFCSGENEKQNCDAVISSKGAVLFGSFKLSDLSLVYFSGMLLVSVLVATHAISTTFFYAIGLGAVSVTIYSLYYQAFVVKQWCGLCLSIVGVVWGQAFLSYYGLHSIDNYMLTQKEVLVTMLSFALIGIFWNYYKPKIEQFKSLKKEKIKYYKFKRNFNLFNSLLNNSGSINTEIPDTNEIVFGNNEFGLPITIVTNPFCGHCKPVHTLIETISKNYKDDTRITIRFNVNTNDKKSDVVQITSRLLELYEIEGSDKCMAAMHAIYAGQEVASWLKEWGKCDDLDKYVNILDNESEWCAKHHINFTPEILIIGKSFPKEYDRKDLIFFIEELNEYYIEQQVIVNDKELIQ